MGTKMLHLLGQPTQKKHCLARTALWRAHRANLCRLLCIEHLSTFHRCTFFTRLSILKNGFKTSFFEYKTAVCFKSHSAAQACSHWHVLMAMLSGMFSLACSHGHALRHVLTGMFSWPCSQACSQGYALRQSFSGMLPGRVSRADSLRQAHGQALGHALTAMLTGKLTGRFSRVCSRAGSQARSQAGMLTRRCSRAGLQ